MMFCEPEQKHTESASALDYIIKFVEQQFYPIT